MFSELDFTASASENIPDQMWETFVALVQISWLNQILQYHGIQAFLLYWRRYKLKLAFTLADSPPQRAAWFMRSPKNKTTHRLWTLQSKQWNMPRNLFRSKEKLLTVDPDEAVSTRIGTVEYFIANTIFCRTQALMRNNWNQSLPTDDRDDTRWRASFCIKPQSGFNSSLSEGTEASM